MMNMRSKHPVVVYACWVLLPVFWLALLPPSAAAQPVTNVEETPPAEITQPEAPPTWLRVTADRVNIRSRADQNSRIIARAGLNDVLESRGIEDGWHKILPTKDVFSIVGAQYIDRVGENSGRVNVDTLLRIRVGSDIQPRDPLLCEVQAKLEHDAEVTIIGQLDAEWLKIVPPAGVYAYVSGEFVEEITPEEAARLQAAQVADQPAAAPPEAAATTTPATRPAELDQTPVAAEEPAPETAEPEKPEKPRALRNFDARGVLKPSFALPPGPYGMRYMLKNQQSDKVTSYIEIPTDLGVDMKACLGKYVGVRGELFKLDDPRVTVLRVTDLVILNEENAARETP